MMPSRGRNVPIRLSSTNAAAADAPGKAWHQAAKSSSTRSRGGSSTTTRLTQEQYNMLRYFILVCIIVLTTEFQCYNSLHGDVCSDASSLYTPAVGVIPLLCKYSNGCSGDRNFRKSCAPTQQVHTVHGTAEDKLQSCAIQTSLQLMPAFFSLLCAVVRMDLSILTAAQCFHASFEVALACSDNRCSELLAPAGAVCQLDGGARFHSSGQQ